MTIRETPWRKTGVDPGWFERLGLITHLLSTRYAQYLACDSVIEPVFVDADGRVVATGDVRPCPRVVTRGRTPPLDHVSASDTREKDRGASH